MKRTISFFTVFAFVLAFSGNVFAQTVSATAEVIQNLDAQKNSDVNFGSIENDLNPQPILDPTDGSGTQGTNGTISYGRINVSGQANATISISWSTSNLTGGSASDELAISLDVSGDRVQSSSSTGGSTISSGATPNLSDPNGDGTGTGHYTVWIGGALSTASGTSTPIASGTYTGDQTFTIDYSL